MAIFVTGSQKRTCVCACVCENERIPVRTITVPAYCLHDGTYGGTYGGSVPCVSLAIAVAETPKQSVMVSRINRLRSFLLGNFSSFRRSVEERTSSVDSTRSNSHRRLCRTMVEWWMMRDESAGLGLFDRMRSVYSAPWHLTDYDVRTW
jgi:hypothetical protein